MSRGMAEASLLPALPWQAVTKKLLGFRVQQQCATAGRQPCAGAGAAAALLRRQKGMPGSMVRGSAVARGQQARRQGLAASARLGLF